MEFAEVQPNPFKTVNTK